MEKLEVKRQPQMAIKDRNEILKIFDDAPVVSVGFIDSGEPVVIPMAFVLLDEKLYLHGAIASRMMKIISGGGKACISATIVNGMVLARSAFSHTMNYRSANLFGVAEKVESEEEKLRVLKALSDKYVLGRWEHLRQPTSGELKSTMVLSFSSDKISGKMRKGPPDDLEKDKDFPVWAGELPFSFKKEEPIQDPNQSPMELPEYLKLELSK